jgi:hypothetical protein
MQEHRFVDKQKLSAWLASAGAKEKLQSALVEVKKANAKFQKAREIDRKDLSQPVTL